MLNKTNFTKTYLKKIAKEYPRVDLIKMEMMVFAFGLLDELIRNEIPLIFKGGTSLLLLLENPRRVSTDIDIIVPNDFDFDKIFEKVKTEFPFYDGEERGNGSNKYFRHFYFVFCGPVSNKICRINLDVAFENNPYQKTIKKELKHCLLLTAGNKTYVEIPTHDSILGDKLTAFAPTTIGVNPFMTSLGKENDNRLQVMKQFYDIARLYDYINDINEISESYKRCQQFENKFRNKNYSIKETLLDTFNHAAEIASMGKWNNKSKFYNDVAKPGILGLTTNIFDGKYNQLSATKDATKIMYLTACLLTNNNFKSNKSYYKGNLLKSFKSITDKESFALIRKSLFLLDKYKIL